MKKQDLKTCTGVADMLAQTLVDLKNKKADKTEVNLCIKGASAITNIFAKQIAYKKITGKPGTIEYFE